MGVNGGPMKIKDLLLEIKKLKNTYKDAEDFDVFIEVIAGDDLKQKKESGHWKFVKDSEDWEYIECAGFNTIFLEEKIFTINANY